MIAKYTSETLAKVKQRRFFFHRTSILCTLMSAQSLTYKAWGNFCLAVKSFLWFGPARINRFDYLKPGMFPHLLSISIRILSDSNSKKVSGGSKSLANSQQVSRGIQDSSEPALIIGIRYPYYHNDPILEFTMSIHKSELIFHYSEIHNHTFTSKKQLLRTSYDQLPNL